jgi:hypothetical protein
MNSRPVIIGSLALSLVGSALVAWVYLNPGAIPAGMPEKFTTERGALGKAKALQPERPAISAPPSVASNDIPTPGSAGLDKNDSLSGEIPHSNRPAASISQKELLARAALVEEEANHDLKHLVSLLDLNQMQQDQIFDTLVRRAPAWHPSMQIDGNTPATNPVNPDAPLLDDIDEVLTPDQQQELADNELNRAEWWAEVIDQLLPTGDILATAQTDPQDPSGSEIGTAAAAALPPPEETAPAGSKDGNGAVIFED